MKCMLWRDNGTVKSKYKGGEKCDLGQPHK
jgi:hypothetical protein